MLTRLALRLATVRALRGRTLARANVRDSEHGEIDEVLTEKPEPIVIVYTDDGQRSPKGNDLFATGQDATQRLVIEFALTMRQKVLDEDGNEDIQAVQPLTDASLEFSLDVMERQIIAALTHPSGDWPQMWNSLVSEVVSVDSQRGISQREGVRFAGRQMTLTVRTPKEPPVGATIGPLWTRFLALVEVDADLAPLRATIEALLTGGDLDADEVFRAAYGLTQDEASAMGLNTQVDAP